jgi:hypothetical protein
MLVELDGEQHADLVLHVRGGAPQVRPPGGMVS